MPDPVELEPTHLGLLDMYREAAGPSPEDEDRMLANIRRALAEEGEQTSKRDGETVANAPRVQPIVAAGIAAAAFAAGVLLTLGLRGTVAHRDDPGDPRSVAPMLADDPPGREGKVRNPDGEVCGTVVIEKEVEVPVPTPVYIEVPQEPDEESSPGPDDIHGQQEPSAGGPSEPIDDSTRNDGSHTTPAGQTVAVVAWPTAIDPSGRGSGVGSGSPSSSSKAGRSGGYGRGGAASGPSRSTGRGGTARPSGGSSQPGSASSGSNDPGPSSTPSPSSDRPGDPPSPSDDSPPPMPPSDGDEPRPPESPDEEGDDPWPPDEPTDDEMPEMPEEDDCDLRNYECHEQLPIVCSEHPIECETAMLECDAAYQECIDPYGGATCEMDAELCMMEADWACEQGDPQLCELIRCDCDLMRAECYGLPAPECTWEGAEHDGEFPF